MTYELGTVMKYRTETDKEILGMINEKHEHETEIYVHMIVIHTHTHTYTRTHIVHPILYILFLLFIIL